MATARSTSVSRDSYRRSYGRNTHKGYGQRQMYIYGNTVRKDNLMPQTVSYSSRKRKKETIRLKSRNKHISLEISPAYVRFLVIAAIVAVMLCVSYLQLQSEIVSRSENIALLQEELVQITEENNTAYQAVADSLNLEEVRNIAINELGMVYAAQGRVTEYKSPESSYVKQYSEIPQNGVLAKSADVSQE
ncbi:MAG: hypothetical protein U0L05_01545 [Schaedlerella sp.]|nr:hypothetical protein [Schaedlerella sp.]